MRSGISNLKSETARPGAGGFTYLALLAAIIIIGIVMASAGKYWQNVMRREKEEELLFRGGQYRSAIQHYFYAKAPNAYPQNIDDLLKDNRTAKGRRHLRQRFKDPITGEDFAVIRDLTRGNRIIGVCSTSDAMPLRQGGFSEENKDFEGKQKYSEWKFVFAPAQAPGTLPVGRVTTTSPPPTVKPFGMN
jgi:type II secretory pathway pseudopilin PulG